MTLAAAVCSILLSVAAQFLLKAGVRESLVAHPASDIWMRALGLVSHYHVLLGFACYGLSAIVWMFVLSKWDVSKAYPMVGLGFVLTLPLGGHMGEQITLPRVAGVMLIVVGVLLVSRS